MNARRRDYNDAPNCWIGTEKGSVMTDSNGVQPKSLLETTLNTRDLGVYHSVLNGKQLRPWRILRSDVQNYPSENDIRLLTERKICTIIDLRGEKEVQRKPSGFAGREGFTYHNIPVEEGSGIPESIDAVSDSYIKIAESERMAEVFCAIAMAPDGVMINCTAGKDRTGVVSAILLGVCGVPDVEIIADYMYTKAYGTERFALIHKNFPEIDMHIVIPRERYITEFLARLRGKYGEFSGYLAAIGVTSEEKNAIVAKLL